MRTRDHAFYRHGSTVSTALLLLLLIVVLPLATAAPEPRCGDGVCNGDETFDSCFEDCSSQDAKEARVKLEQALDAVDENETGWEKIEEARKVWYERNWSKVKRLATEAVEEHREATLGGDTPPVDAEKTTDADKRQQGGQLGWLLAAIIVIVAGAGVWLYQSSSGNGTAGEGSEDEELDQRMAELTMKIGDKLEAEVEIDQDKLLSKIDAARDKLEEGLHDKAVELIEEVERKIKQA